MCHLQKLQLEKPNTLEGETFEVFLRIHPTSCIWLCQLSSHTFSVTVNTIINGFSPNLGKAMPMLW